MFRVHSHLIRVHKGFGDGLTRVRMGASVRALGASGTDKLYPPLHYFRGGQEPRRFMHRVGLTRVRTDASVHAWGASGTDKLFPPLHYWQRRPRATPRPRQQRTPTMGITKRRRETRQGWPSPTPSRSSSPLFPGAAAVRGGSHHRTLAKVCGFSRLVSRFCASRESVPDGPLSLLCCLSQTRPCEYLKMPRLLNRNRIRRFSGEGEDKSAHPPAAPQAE